MCSPLTGLRSVRGPLGLHLKRRLLPPHPHPPPRVCQTVAVAAPYPPFAPVWRGDLADFWLGTLKMLIWLLVACLFSLGLVSSTRQRPSDAEAADTLHPQGCVCK